MGKYFKYALGEILLVVIGILIALGINNWKTNIDNKKIEQKYYCNILKDLNTDKQQLQDRILENQNSIKIGKELIKDLHSLKLSKNQIFEKYVVAIRSTAYIPTNVTYTDIISSGNLDLLKNDRLKEELIKYQSDLEEINSRIKTNRNFTVERFMQIESVLEFGWQSATLSGIELSKDVMNLLPNNEWHLKKDSDIFKSIVDIIFYCMTTSNRESELYEDILSINNALSIKLEKVCNKISNNKSAITTQ